MNLYEMYIGVKFIKATPKMKDGKEGYEGYEVIYEDGYVSWSPKDVFEKAYRPAAGLTFGLAIEALKLGKKVDRSGWNGKGMFLFIVRPNEIEYKEKLPDELKACEHLLSIAMKTADNKILVGWIASQSDMLSEDWEIVE